MSDTKQISELIAFPVKYDEHGGYFYDRSNNMIAQIRGFGRLSYTKEGNRDFEAAAEKQNLVGQFIAAAINERAQMESEVERLKKALANIKADLTSGDFCRYVEHAQDLCVCEDVRNYFKSLEQEAK